MTDSLRQPSPQKSMPTVVSGGSNPPFTEMNTSVKLSAGTSALLSMTEQKLREKIAKVHRCYRNCRLYPALCQKHSFPHRYSRCRIKCDKPDYELADQILALTDEYYKEKYKGWVKLDSIEIEHVLEILDDDCCSICQSIKQAFGK